MMASGSGLFLSVAGTSECTVFQMIHCHINPQSSIPGTRIEVRLAVYSPHSS